jgi:hypothetical protein
MNPIFTRMRAIAFEIIAQNPPVSFYQDAAGALDFSLRFFKSDPLLSRLKHFVSENLDDDFGHGWEHAKSVTIEAGALAIMEGRRMGDTQKEFQRQVRLVQCSGLLHDMKRKKKDHAAIGADYARKVLADFDLAGAEIDDICLAISCHEAFKPFVAIKNVHSKLISDCLYDADKFRWGPDNFKNTLWEMVSFINPRLAQFVGRYPQGMAALYKIKNTFRSETGQKYGPEFIDAGIAIGDELLKRIKDEFAAQLDADKTIP